MNADDSAARDWQRAKVYAAEEFVRTLFDRAAEHGSRSVEFFGAQLTLPPEARSKLKIKPSLSPAKAI